MTIRIVTFRLDWGKSYNTNQNENEFADANYYSGTPLPEGTSIYAFITVNLDKLLNAYINNGGPGGIPWNWILITNSEWLLNIQMNITIDGVNTQYNNDSSITNIIFGLKTGMTNITFTGGNLISQFTDFNIIAINDIYFASWFGVLYINPIGNVVLTSITTDYTEKPALSFVKNSLLFYQAGSTPACGACSSSVNSRHKSRRI